MDLLVDERMLADESEAVVPEEPADPLLRTADIQEKAEFPQELRDRSSNE
jgi:hypothetical protein